MGVLLLAQYPCSLRRARRAPLHRLYSGYTTLRIARAEYRPIKSKDTRSQRQTSKVGTVSKQKKTQSKRESIRFQTCLSTVDTSPRSHRAQDTGGISIHLKFLSSVSPQGAQEEFHLTTPQNGIHIAFWMTRKRIIDSLYSRKYCRGTEEFLRIR